MQIQTTIQQTTYTADLSQPIVISLPLVHGENNPNCFYAPTPVFEPVRAGNFVGATAEGGPVNFFNVSVNPHGNGTHTECVGHIARETYTINQCLQQSHFPALLVSVPVTEQDGDSLVTREALEQSCALFMPVPEALVIRTLPNGSNKQTMQYSGTNPPYITAEAMGWIASQGVQHLLVDIPSVDREQDNGVLAAHHIFWNYPANPRLQATITEMVFIPNEIPDGLYLVNIQVPGWELDAAPSRIALFPLRQMP
ncbi:MAG: cyclase family protein [Dinghuibacter sp.]|nr:cyclase family protein [Dinghuibacter sp.]